MFTHCEGIYLTGFPGQIATHEKILRNGMSSHFKETPAEYNEPTTIFPRSI